jgi:hypothetical protein
MNWIQALKAFNQGKTEFCIPKKGSKEYDQVRGIMKGEPPAGGKKKSLQKQVVDLGNIVEGKRVRKPKRMD